MAFPGITYDMWCDFEGLTDASTVTVGELIASTHGAAGTWTVTGTSSTGRNNKEDPHTVTDDAGVRGMGHDPTTSNHYIEWALPSSDGTVSIGFWLKTSVYGAFASGPTVFKVFNSGFGALVRIQDERNAGSDARQIRMVEGGSGITVADETWYWVTAQFTSSGTVKLRVYNTSLSQVGSEQSYTDATASTVTSVHMGNSGVGVAPTGGVLVGFDDFIIDYTNSVFPLLPATGGQTVTWVGYIG